MQHGMYDWAHIWCEYLFKNIQILLFVYIIEGAALDRGVLGLFH